MKRADGDVWDLGRIELPQRYDPWLGPRGVLVWHNGRRLLISNPGDRTTLEGMKLRAPMVLIADRGDGRLLAANHKQIALIDEQGSMVASFQGTVGGFLGGTGTFLVIDQRNQFDLPTLRVHSAEDGAVVTEIPAASLHPVVARAMTRPATVGDFTDVNGRTESGPYWLGRVMVRSCPGGGAVWLGFHLPTGERRTALRRELPVVEVRWIELGPDQ